MPFPFSATALHLVLLCAFLGVTSTWMLWAVINWMRVRHVRMTWMGERTARALAWPAAFTAAVVAALAGAWWAGQMLWAVVLAGYGAGGAFWFTAAFLARTVLVSRYGVVAHAGRGRQAVAWQQVVDYFSRPGAGRYVFFYEDEFYESEGRRRHRLELQVPPAYRVAFAALVQEKVDARFAFDEQQAHAER